MVPQQLYRTQWSQLNQSRRCYSCWGQKHSKSSLLYLSQEKSCEQSVHRKSQCQIREANKNTLKVAMNVNSKLMLHAAAPSLDGYPSKIAGKEGKGWGCWWWGKPLLNCQNEVFLYPLCSRLINILFVCLYFYIYNNDLLHLNLKYLDLLSWKSLFFFPQASIGVVLTIIPPAERRVIFLL